MGAAAVHSSRRRWLVSLAATGCLASIPGRLARAGAGRRRVLVIGDSMISGAFGLYLAQGLARELGHEVHRHGKPSSGLARPDFYDWQARAKALVEEFRPDTSVVMFGGNDVQGLYMGKDEQKWIRWQEPGWREEYARRLGTLCDTLAPHRQQLFWVGMPVMRPPKFHMRVQRINTIARAEMAIRRNASFVDTWGLLANEDGEYTDRLLRVEGGRRRRILVRAGDGIHLTRAGAGLLRDHVLAWIERELANA